MPLPPHVQGLLNRIFGTSTPPPNDLGRVLVQAQERAAWREVYALLELYYANNALYDSLQRRLYEQGQWHEGMKALRNPTYRVVEFYAAKIWGGYADELKIESENDRLEPAIRRVWRWSNWATRKTLAARKLAMLGDWFAKAAQNADRTRVYFQLLEPFTVTDFETDDRDNIVWVRIDVPKTRRSLEARGDLYYTEVWSKDQQAVTIWEEHNKAPETPLEQLPPSSRRVPFEALGIDFVPIVHCPFKDVGHARGQAAIMAAVDKIDEVNRAATRMHQMQFRNNKVFWALQANQVGPDGRPISAPRIQPDDPATPTTPSGVITVGDEPMYRLPGNASLAPLVPDLDYDAMLAMLKDDMLELEKDLPELAYYRIRDMSEISGAAVRLLLSDTIDRAIEVRGLQYDAVVRLNMMALHIGQAAGMAGFEDLGDFDADELLHTIEGPDIIPVGKKEKAETRQVEAQAAVTLHEVGVSRETLLDELGYDPEAEATQREAEEDVTAGAMLTAFDRGNPALTNGRRSA